MPGRPVRSSGGQSGVAPPASGPGDSPTQLQRNDAMWIRSLHVFAVLGCLLMATALQAQIVEEESTEVLKSIEKTYQPRQRPDLDEAATRIIDLTNKFRKDE